MPGRPFHVPLPELPLPRRAMEQRLKENPVPTECRGKEGVAIGF